MGKSVSSSLIITLVAIILGLLVGALFLLVMGYSPLDAYGSLFTGMVGNTYNVGEMIQTVTPLIFTGLSVAFAFRTGLFNIGVEGQFIMGQLAAIAVATKLALPPGIHQIVALLAAVILGGLYAGIAGILKAKLQVHEVITTIMLNYIALGISNFLIRTMLHGSTTDRTAQIPNSASLHIGWLSDMFSGARMNLGIFLAILAVLLVYWILNRTVLGYELRAVGFNTFASEYAGMNVSRNITLSMIISGMFAAIGGAVQTLGVIGYMPVSAEFSGVGFDGMAVALIGNNNPFGVFLSAILYGGLSYGSTSMQRDLGVPTEIIRIVISIIIFLVAANGIIRTLSRVLNRRGVRKS
jgi:general nucleoside transport system permease protein